MPERHPLREPLAFLLRFAAIAGVLFLLRAPICRTYLTLVAPPANWLLGGVGAHYVRQGYELALWHGPAQRRPDLGDDADPLPQPRLAAGPGTGRGAVGPASAAPGLTLALEPSP